MFKILPLDLLFEMLLNLDNKYSLIKKIFSFSLSSPQGDLLIALSCYPENKIYIWNWELQSVLYISSDLPLFIHSMSFSSHKKDVFVTSGEKHVM